MSVLPPTCEHGSALLCTGNAKLHGEGEGKKRRNTDLEAAQREGRVSPGPARSFFSLFTVRSSGTKKQQNGYAPPPPPARSFGIGFEEARAGLTEHSHSVLVNNYVEERARNRGSKTTKRELGAMADSVMFEDIFTISVVDPDGKKFDRVSRLVAHSEQFDMDLLLDVNIDVYPIARSEKKFTLALAATLNLDGTQDDGTFDQTRRKSLADKYEYVMYGKVYKCADASAAATAAGGGRRGSGATAKVEVYISFGGLLMCLKGEPNNLSNLLLDQRVYLLMRKVG
jgi:DNA-directed RNA polymerase I, II, and III subunit RPABC3